LNQFKEEQHSTHFFWCALTDKVQARLENAFESAPSFGLQGITVIDGHLKFL
jgi:hypothetical protein